MLTELNNKVAVVTGAASGIGAALARGLAAEGMRVALADLDESGVQAVAADIGGEAVAYRVDVADEASVQALADAVFAHFGQVDLLINNAGVFQGGLTWERSTKDWEWTFGVNVFGITNGIRAFVPRMMAQDTEGHVVNTASVAAYVAGPMSAPYVVSKNAAMSVTECLALDLDLCGAKIGASVLTPSSFNTGIAQTASLRPDSLGSDATEDGVASAEALQSILNDGGADPAEAVQPVIDGVRNGTFLIATKPSFKNQLQVRYDALLQQALPPMAELD